MAGFGTAPMGTSGAGLGVPVTAADPPTGPAGSRYINPATGDFEQDSDTLQLKQMPIERQQVLLALKTLYGSAAAAPTFGVRPPKKMGSRFQSEMTAAVRAALRHLTDEQKVIRLNAVTVTHGQGGRGLVHVDYTITRTGKQDVLTL
jgi:hypothetical protein